MPLEISPLRLRTNFLISVRVSILGCFALLTNMQPVAAQDLKFSFTNPSFGGNPFNSSHLLGLAEIQRQHEESRPDQTTGGNNQSDLFVRQLQSRLLSSLSASLAETITGAEPGDTDTLTIGDQEIFYERGAATITLVITNLLDGSSTTIEVPVINTL